MDIETLHAFLGWCTIINFGLLAISALIVLALREKAAEMHARMFQLDKAWVLQAYFSFLVHYKIAIIVFNLVPYIALSLVA